MSLELAVFLGCAGAFIESKRRKKKEEKGVRHLLGADSGKSEAALLYFKVG